MALYGVKNTKKIGTNFFEPPNLFFQPPQIRTPRNKKKQVGGGGALGGGLDVTKFLSRIRGVLRNLSLKLGDAMKFVG